MNQEQMYSLLRIALQIGGTVATTFGWLTPDKVATLTAQILAVAGPITILGATIWGMIARTDKNIVAAAAATPTVQAITVNDPVVAAAAKKADPATTVTVNP